MFNTPLSVRTTGPLPGSSDAKVLEPTVTQLSSDTIATYHYAPLGLNEIRILELIPSRQTGNAEGQLLRGRILTANVDNPPEYSALSYTWGETTLSHELLVLEGEGADEKQCVLSITAQLYQALLCLQDADESRFYWIDQVSINQDDIQERKEQVMLMKTIYQGAATTILWLGECKDEGDLSLLRELSLELQKTTLLPEQIKERLADTKKRFPNALKDAPWDRIVQETYDTDNLEHLIDAEAKDDSTPEARRVIAAKRLFNQPWFSRAWIVQEVVVSRKIRVLYDTMEMSYEMLGRIGHLVDRVLSDHLGWRYGLYNKTSGYGAFQSVEYFKRRFDSQGATCDHFLELLWSLQNKFKSTDPRDMVYAILGLRPNHSYPEIVADYAVSDAEAYADTARAIIDLTGSLTVFGVVEGNTVWKCACSSTIPNLPTWAPNWSMHFHGARPMSWVDLPSAFSAARGVPHKSSDPSDPMTLVVKGKLVGLVGKIFPQNFGGGYSYFDGLPKLLRLDEIVQQIQDDRSGKDSTDDPSSNLSHVVLRTLLADGAFTKSQPLVYPLEDLMRTCKHDAGGFAAKKQAQDNVLQTAQSSSLILQSRRFFETSTPLGQSFGLSNLYARSGDMICLLHGSPTPVILRQTVIDPDPSKQRFKVMCQCYLDGWMYGETGDEAWWQAFERDPQTYHLI